MSHQQPSWGQQQQQQQQPQQEETGLTMDQILQYLAQYTMVIEQLLSRRQTQGEVVKPLLFDGEGGRLYQCLPPIHQHEDEGEWRRGEDIVDVNVCAERSSGSMEGKCIGGKEAGSVVSRNSGGTFYQDEGGILRV